MNWRNFNAIVCTGDRQIGNKGFITFRKQTSLERLKKHFNETYPKWTFMTCYDRKTNEKELVKRN